MTDDAACPGPAFAAAYAEPPSVESARQIFSTRLCMPRGSGSPDGELFAVIAPGPGKPGLDADPSAGTQGAAECQHGHALDFTTR